MFFKTIHNNLYNHPSRININIPMMVAKIPRYSQFSSSSHSYFWCFTKYQNGRQIHKEISKCLCLSYKTFCKIHTSLTLLFQNNSSIITMVILTHMFFQCTSSVSLQKCNLIFYSKEHDMPRRVQYLITSGASICHSSSSSPANLQITDAGHHTINPLCVVCVYNVLFSVTLTTVECLRLLANAWQSHRLKSVLVIHLVLQVSSLKVALLFDIIHSAHYSCNQSHSPTASLCLALRTTHIHYVHTRHLETRKSALFIAPCNVMFCPIKK
jgi:hypothetical protein